MAKGCLTVEEAARISGLSESQLERLCQNGELYTHNKAGGQEGPWAIPPRTLILHLRKRGLPVGEELLTATGHVSFK